MPPCALSSTGRYGGAATRPWPGDAIGNGAPRIAGLITKRNCSTSKQVCRLNEAQAAGILGGGHPGLAFDKTDELRGRRNSAQDGPYMPFSEHACWDRR